MELSEHSFSGTGIHHLPPLVPGLQLCDVESVLPDETKVCVLWRMVPVDVDGGGVNPHSRHIGGAADGG